MKLLLLLLLVVHLTQAATNRLNNIENQKLQGECGSYGIRKLYGGQLASQSMAPWSLLMRNRNVGTICSASLISPRHILLSAHCVLDTSMNPTFKYHSSDCDGSSLIYSVSASMIYFETADGNQINGNIQQIILPEHCPYSSFHNHDIAIVELDRDVSFDVNHWPVCVASDPQLTNPGTSVMIAAFGSELADLSIPSSPPTLRYGYTRITSTWLQWFRTGYYDGGVVERPGDSGSGAIVKSNGRNFVVGVASQANVMFGVHSSVIYYSREICRITGVCRV